MQKFQLVVSKYRNKKLKTYPGLLPIHQDEDPPLALPAKSENCLDIWSWVKDIALINNRTVYSGFKMSKSGETAKSNPYIGKPIGKHLLTPCRQVGIPRRKKKTPNNQNNSLELSCTKTPDSNVAKEKSDPVEVINLTPLVKAVVEESSPAVEKPKNKKPPPKKTPPTKSKKKIRKIEESSEDEEVELKTPQTINSSPEMSDFQSKPKPESSEENKPPQVPVAKENKNKTSIKRTARRLISSDDEEVGGFAGFTVVNKLETVTGIDLTKDDDEPATSSNSTKTRRRFVDSSDEEDIPLATINNKPKKFKRCLSIKKSQDFEKTSIPEKLNSMESPAEDVEKSPDVDVEALMKSLEEKRKLVDDLKRAEIYKKKHDVDKLQELTQVWKNGCISALNDLLAHLKIHGDINMETLLKNLNIPEEKIALSPDGDLI